MLVNNKTEFDAAMATATSTTIIELPEGAIDWELTISKPCTVLGNNTIINLTGSGIEYAATITNSCELSGISIQTDRSGISLADGANLANISIAASECGMLLAGDGSGGYIENIQITGPTGRANQGFYFKDARNYTLSAVSATLCTEGYFFEGASDIIGDTESDPAWVTGTSPVPELERTNRTHSIKISGALAYNNTFGIRLLNSNAVEFDSSRVFDNSQIGVWQMPNSYNNKFNGEIYKNTLYGVKNTDRQGNLHDFDARQTWWGDITGPSGYGKGSGQKISTNISIEPWLRDGTDPDQLLYPNTRAWIWGQLGYPLVRVELTEQQITEDILMAIDRFMYYQTAEADWAYGTVAQDAYEVDLTSLKDRYGNPVSITKHQVIEVAYQPYNDLFAQLTGSGMDFFLTYYMQSSGGLFLADFYTAMVYKDDLEKTLGINPTYEIISHMQPNGTVKDFVRLYPKASAAIKVGVKFNRTLTQEEVDSQTWIRKYALAWAKEQLGRIRSKYSSLPSPTGETTLDGSTLLSEAQQEKTDLMNEIIGLSEPLSFTIG